MGLVRRFFASVFLQPRWSTAVLAASVLAVGAIAYFLGARHDAVKTKWEPRLVRLPLPSSTEGRKESPRTAEAAPESPADALEKRWERALAQLRTPAADDEKAECLDAMAALNPRRALELALGEPDLRLREKLRDAVLRGWATRFPDDASAWVLALPPAEQHAAMAAVFGGAASQPEEAVRLGRRLGAQFPNSAGEYGSLAVNALNQNGAYAIAMRFVLTDETLGREASLHATFFHWASHQPEIALKGLGEITNPELRRTAFQGLVAGWAGATPATFADYAARLPAGDDRTEALARALPEWAQRDPLSASEWMIHGFTPSADLDAGVLAVATLPSLIAERPEVAIGWAENIADPKLRADTLRDIARDWAQRDAGAVRSFLVRTPNLDDAERKAFGEALNAPGG